MNDYGDLLNALEKLEAEFGDTITRIEGIEWFRAQAKRIDDETSPLPYDQKMKAWETQVMNLEAALKNKRGF